MQIDERLEYFRTQIQDIREHKMNEWRFSYYGVLIQAALAAVNINLGNSPWWVPAVLSLLSVMTFFAILWLILDAMIHIRHSHKVHRDLMQDDPETLYEAFEKIRQLEERA